MIGILADDNNDPVTGQTFVDFETRIWLRLRPTVSTEVTVYSALKPQRSTACLRVMPISLLHDSLDL